MCVCSDPTLTGIHILPAALAESILTHGQGCDSSLHHIHGPEEDVHKYQDTYTRLYTRVGLARVRGVFMRKDCTKAGNALSG